MAKDDVEIEVAAFAPNGNRVPPPGPARGRRKTNKVSGREQARMNRAKRTPPDEPAAKAADVIAAFARDAAKRLASPPVQDAPAASTPGMGASLEEFFRKRKADKTDAGNSNT
jgi:hypothetical protein